MYNREGIELCHPNPALIGQKIEKNNSGFSSGNKEQFDFRTVLSNGKINSGIREFPKTSNRSSEIVTVYPVFGSDWMVASHTNTNVLKEEISNLYQKFILVFLLSTLFILGISFILIRFIYRKYETQKNNEIYTLNNEVNNLAALNNQLSTIKEKHQSYTGTEDNGNTSSKKRINTYHKDELISIETNEIAYFSLENNVVYIRTFGGNQFTINSSLDEVIKTLDLQIFYRANRQFIINIKAIKNILIFGKNQLKLVTNPESEEIIISKNKVSEFKKWLEQ